MEVRSLEPLRVPVTYLDVVLTSGREFSAALRADRGDVLTDTPDTLTVKFGSGEVTVIARNTIAMMTTRTAELVVPAKPLTDAMTKAPTL